MKKIMFLLAVIILLSITFVYAIPPQIPMLILPPDGSQHFPVEWGELVWIQPDYTPGPYLIEIYLDEYPYFPAPPVYSGPGMEFWFPPEFHYPTGTLQEGQTYFWKIRITNTMTMESSESLVWSFTVQVITYNISGHIVPGNPSFDVSGVTVSCPGAVEPSVIITGPDGAYSFDVPNDAGNYMVTPVKADYYFEPPSAFFENIQTNLVQDFVMNSLLPHAACNPIPVDGDIYVPHDLGRISWQYIPQPGYALPTEFEVYIPADAPEPIGIVPYTGRAVDMFLDISGEIQGESTDAKVKSKNGHGEGIDILSWSWGMTNSGSFHTGGGGGGRPRCDYPGYAGKVNFSDIVLKLQVDVPTPVLLRSCYTVFLDTGIVPLTVVYQGIGLPDPLDPTRCYFYSPELQPNTIYHWFVRMVDPATADTIDTNNYAFRTAVSLVEPTSPLLVSPVPGALSIPPEGVDLIFEQNPWLVDSFFDIFVDIDPDFPEPPVYTGPLVPSGPYFEFHKAALLAEQPYYWYVRYTNFMDNWYSNSLVRQFTTGQYVIPSSNISGTISSVHNVSACTVTCPQAVAPASVSTGYYGTFSFTVNNGLNPVVTPAKQGYFFTPGFHQFNNIQTNQTANFTMTSLKPWLASQPLPSINAQNISPMLGSLQWSYIHNSGYSLPDGFTVWFGPVGDVLPLEEVSFNYRTDFSVNLPPSMLPLDYSATYEWKVVPHNEAGGEAEGVVTWTFTTAPLPVPILLLPANGALNIDPEGVNLIWEVGGGYQVESFFDIFVDIDPDFPSPPLYSGPVLPSRYQFQYYTGTLMENMVYYWKVRCHAFGDYWESAVFSFVTGVNPLITYSTISGTVTFGGAAASGVMVTCPTACIPKQVFTGINGNYSFTVTNGNAVAYVITPTKNWWNWFQPATWTSPVPVTGNIGNVNFTMNSLKANVAFQPLPVQHAEGVTINLPHLQWEFAQQAGYDLPYEFHIYFPDFSSNYVVVPYTGDRSLYQVPTPYALPLDYNTTYTWKVVPWNPDGGDAENVPIWDFTTVESNPPPIPQAIYPTDGLGDICDNGLIMEWGPPPGGGFSPESFFDVYLELDMAEAELIYTGPGLIDPLNPTSRFCYAPDLLLGATYHWWVRVTDPVTGLYSESYHNFFFVSPLHLMHAIPELIDPALGETGVPPDNMDHVFWMDDCGNMAYFDIYNGLTPDCTNHLVGAYWNVSRTYFIWHCSTLMDQQTYYWFVRYSNWVDHWFSNSLVGQFVTGTYTPPPNPELVSPIDLSKHITSEDIHFIWEEEEGWYNSHPDSFFDVYYGTSPTPTTLVYHGHGAELYSGGQFTFNLGAPPEVGQNYWFVRITDGPGGTSSVSPTNEFIGEPHPDWHPGLIEPEDRASDIPSLNIGLRWSLPDGDWLPESFFDVYCDTNPAFPNPPVFSGPILPSRTYFEWHIAAALAETPYYWFVRYSCFIDNVLQHFDSSVHMFTTGPYSAEMATLSGHVIPGSPLFDASGVTLTCPTACIPTTVTTGLEGYYCFTIQKGMRHIVTPEETEYRFEPPLGDFDNVQTDIIQDFTKISLMPNPACNPIPVDGDVYVPMDFGTISWQYIPQPGFTPPTEFRVYVPADAPEPVGIVPYNSRALDYFIHIGDIPGESAKVKSEREIELLSFSWGETNTGAHCGGGGGAGKPKCDVPEYSAKVTVEDLTGKVKPTSGRAEFPADSFFDVFLDTNILPTTNVYHGPGMVDPTDPTGRVFFLPELLPNTIYHWFVRLTVPSIGDTIDSNNYAFRTAQTLTDYPPPLLLNPAPGASGIPPEGVDLQFEMTPWISDSFFDIFVDVDPDFPNPPVFSGSLPPSRTFFTFHKAALLAEQPYYWYVRYTNLVDNWYANSLVRQFTTGQYVVPSSNITGTISSVFNVSACTVTCPQAVAPASVSTGYAGTFSFTVNNGLNPIVTPTKTGYYFTPASYQFTNIQANQTANFTMNSLKPNLASQPIPGINATGVSIYLDRLECDYIQHPSYSPPTGFHLYFPADNPVPIECYIDENGHITYDEETMDVLNPSCSYNWKMVPYNDYGEAEGAPVWSFTTGELMPPPAPVLLSPPNGSVGYWYYECLVEFDVSGDWRIDSFFDIYLEDASLLPPEPDYLNITNHLYCGVGNEIFNEGIFTFHCPPLLPGHTYYWYVKFTNSINGLSSLSPIWHFSTEMQPLTLLYPSNGQMGLPPEEITLQFDHAYWQVDSFFDIYVDVDPDFPEEPAYSGPLMPPRSLLLYNIGPLMAEQMFYWKVRVTQGMDQWTSAVQTFTTGTYTLPSHVVSGTLYNQNNIATGGRRITYYANNAFMGYTTSSLNPPYGAYSITLPNSSSIVYKVVPSKTTLLQYWSPNWRTYTSLTADQTGQNYTLCSYSPNQVILPVPYNYAENVSISIGHLQWTYPENSNYALPLGFEVYFPAGSQEPYQVVPYSRDPVFTVDIPPLEYLTPYTWEVKPYNDQGYAEYMEQWNFTTEESPYPFPPTPLYVYPGNHETDVDNVGLVMAWGPTPGRDEYPPDSFFDVFCDIDPAFPGPPIFSGPDPGPPDPFNPPNCIHVPNLLPGMMYYWKVVVTYPSTGMSTEGPTWDFITSQLPPMHPSPVLISPPDGSGGILPGEVPLVWDQPEYVPESFFDVFFDISPINPDYPDPATLIYSGPGIPLRTLFEWHCSAYMTEQVYYWFVRYSNYVDYWFSKSPLGTFMTGTGLLPPPILTIEPPGMLSWTAVPGADYYNVYKSPDPYGPFLLAESTPGLMWLDPDLTQGRAFYYVTAVATARTDDRSFVPGGKK